MSIQPILPIKNVPDELIRILNDRFRNVSTASEPAAADGGTTVIKTVSNVSTTLPKPAAPSLVAATATVTDDGTTFTISGTMTMPSNLAHLVRAFLVARGPAEQQIEASIYAFDITAGAVLDYQTVPVALPAAPEEWTAEFYTENEEGAFTPHPSLTRTLDIPEATVVGETTLPLNPTSVTLAEVTAAPGKRRQGVNQTTVVDATVTILLPPGHGAEYVGVDFSNDTVNYGYYGRAQVVGNLAVFTIVAETVPAHGGNWRARCFTGKTGAENNVFTAGVYSNVLAVAGIGPPSVTSIGSLTVTGPTYRGSNGIEPYWSLKLSGVFPAALDANLWHLTFTVEGCDENGDPDPGPSPNATERLWFECVNGGTDVSGYPLDGRYNARGWPYEYLKIRCYGTSRAATIVPGFLDPTSVLIEWPDGLFEHIVRFGPMPDDVFDFGLVDPDSLSSDFRKKNIAAPGDPPVWVFTGPARSLSEGVVNASFEDGDHGWELTAHVAIDSHSYTGSTCLTAVGTVGAAIYAITEDYYQVKPGEKYVVRLSARQSGASQDLKVAVYWYAEPVYTAGLEQANTILLRANHTDWAEAQFTVTVPDFPGPVRAGFARVVPMYWDGYNPFNEGWWSVDNIRVSRVQKAADLSIAVGLAANGSGDLEVKMAGAVKADANGALIVGTSAMIGLDGSDNLTVQPLAIDTGHLADQSLKDLRLYSSTVRAVTITFGEPTLPNALYPTGAVIFDTAAGTYKANVANTWKSAAKASDLIAGTLAVGVLYGGTLAAGQVVSGSFTGRELYLTKNNTAISIDCIYDGFDYGVHIEKASGRQSALSLTPTTIRATMNNQIALLGNSFYESVTGLSYYALTLHNNLSGGALDVTLSSYTGTVAAPTGIFGNIYTKAQVDALLAGYASQTWVIAQLSGYATQAWVNGRGFVTLSDLTSALSNYATNANLTAGLNSKVNHGNGYLVWDLARTAPIGLVDL